MDFRIITKRVAGTAFSFYSSEEIKQLSVKQITSPLGFDILGQSIPNGLYDLALGPTDKTSSCITCGLSNYDCPGHMGHIQLCVPCYQPLLFDLLLKLLKMKCFHCHHFRATPKDLHDFLFKLKLLDAGMLLEYSTVCELLENTTVTAAEAASEAADSKSRKDETELETEGRARLAERLQKYEEEADHIIRTVGVNRDNQHINQARRREVRNFFRTGFFKTHCPRCRALSPTFRHDAFSKIFMITSDTVERDMKTRNTRTSILSDVTEVETEEKHMDEKMAKEQSKSKKKHNSDMEDDDESVIRAGEKDSDADEEMEEDDAPKRSRRGKPTGPQQSTETKRARLLFPNEAERHIKLLWKNHKDVLEAIFNASGDSRLCPGGQHLRMQDYRMFFVHVLGVPPNRFRPAAKMGDMTFDNPQNHYYSKIITANQQILELSHPSDEKEEKEEKEEKSSSESSVRVDPARVATYWIELQTAINCLMDSARNPNPAQAKNAPEGIRQQLERKEGLFRMHMMGKRVNYAARSVISPDPYLHTNEVGIPERFAKTLSFPQPVTQYNVHEMRQAVINGPDVYPGANFIQDETGALINLKYRTPEQRVALSKTLLTGSLGTAKSQSSTGMVGRGGAKVVLRHVKNGDVLLANRQPTLHKPSMMAHKARILTGQQTIRMHYANCKTYNADFDGDEINLHFPQNDIARAELYTIANTDNQYIIPTNGKPIRGLIQDHVVSGVLLTARDSFFTKDEYQQLVYTACYDADPRAPIRMLPPAILKPRPMWTGKQVISSLLLHTIGTLPPLTTSSTASVPESAWFKGSEEHKVIVRQNELVCGVLDKNQFGASAFGLVHAVYEMYGSGKAGDLLTAFGRLFTAFLQSHGFSCGMDDLVINPHSDQLRAAAVAKSVEEGVMAAATFAEVEVGKVDDFERVKEIVSQGIRAKLRNPALSANLDGVMKQALNKTTSAIIDKCLPAGLIKPFPYNCMSMMTLSGAKGSKVNQSQISCLLGQQELEGRRVPIMVSGRSLPSFAPFDPSPRAGGYVTQRFLSGIRPQEFYFHCMAGREGLVDTAVKTARSGYLQRCIIKGLEALRVHYDYTVRDCDGSVVQFHYGEDSLDVTRTQYLNKFTFFANNYNSLLHKLNPSAMLRALDKTTAAKYNKNLEGKDPMMSKYSPALYLGCVSEKFQAQLQKYIEQNPDKLLNQNGVSADKFKTLMWLNYLKALVDPGESVGCLAGQSVGEPSTQMTLNTFHLAGHGAKNVTLGIPRLREIIQTASADITTPLMELKLKDPTNKEAADAVVRRLYRLTLTEAVDFISVSETVEKIDNEMQRKYQLRINFLPLRDPKYTIYKHSVRYEELVRAVETQFVPKLMAFLMKEFKKSGLSAGKSVAVEQQENIRPEDVITSAKVKPVGAGSGKANDEDGGGGGGGDDDEPRPSRAKGEEEEVEEEDADIGGDGDATEAALRSKKSEGQDYSDDEGVADGSESEEEHGDEEEKGQKAKGKAEDKKYEADLDASDDPEAGVSERVRNLLGNYRNLAGIRYDPQFHSHIEITLIVPLKTKKILLVSQADNICKSVFVRATKNIRSCTAEHRDNNGVREYLVSTEGVNIPEVWRCADLVDVNKLDTNDIVSILKTYGVEACRASIVKQIHSVFEAYGIGVDTRHLTLLADYMTFQGGYRAMSRMGIDANTSPWLKMSFETSMQFLTGASKFGEVDSMASPSSRLILGQVVGGGTGAFDLMQPLTR